MTAPNVFESGARKVVPTVLVVVRQDGTGPGAGELLMVHRGDPGDFHAGKWNALGGKLEADESPLEAAVRELEEEAGLRLPPARFLARGAITFPLFKPARNEDVIMFLFAVAVTPAERASVRASCDHGKLHWVAESALAELPLWPGDREFLPQILAGESVLGTVWYRDGRVERAWVTPARSAGT